MKNVYYSKSYVVVVVVVVLVGVDHIISGHDEFKIRAEVVG